jgi:GSCFA family
MELKLNFNVPNAEFEISHTDFTVLIGSCFSDEMAVQFADSGFNIDSNAFGTLFHPSAIANVISSSIEDSEKVDIHQRDDLFLSWDSASRIYSLDRDSLIESILTARREFKKNLSSAKLLIVTFGTAWGYHHKELNMLVGNCHKAPTREFDKVLTSSKDISERWLKIVTDIKILNPSIEIVFTVSPVRHKKDGLIENNRSKARLIESVHEIVESTSASYFPSYEILIDELRDYRFYGNDLVHPSSEAVEYIWNIFGSSCLSDSTLDLIKKIRNIKASINHTSLHPDSQADALRITNANKEMEAMRKEHPEIYWE